MIRHTFLAAIAALALVAPASAETAPKPAVTVQGAWARATPGGATNGAAYVTIVTGSAGDSLVGADTTASERAEVHEHLHENGIMKMRRVDKVEIKPGATLTMEPMGYHVMLLGLKAPLKAGDTVHLGLTFQNAGKLEIDVPVLAIGAPAPAAPAAPAPAGHDHH